MSGLKRAQRGVSLSGLLMAAVVIGLVAMLGVKVVPPVINYFKLVQAVKAVSKDPATKTATVPDIRRAIQARFIVDNIDTVQPADIDISKDGSDVVLSFNYSQRIPVVGNVSLLIDFEGSSSASR
ncbi:MAG TPA: DUF4845 domain-containing protein [Rhodocyclaceae bacterium]|nr:DUF4845 domain-containing protein [Rhodocyclaceae bacterium]